ncbi:MAG TPA: sugar ABC transporter permease [Nitrososphaerales archaeon]|nr:sugar ABC transporter permease [Nitrososphaerales archaeon]
MAKSWYLFLVPLLALLSLIEFYPLLYSIYLSVTNATGGFSLTNYSAMVRDPAFWTSANVSILYSLSSTLLAVGIGVGLIYILAQDFRGRRLCEILFILPMAVAPIVVGTLWSPASVWDDIQSFMHFVLGFHYFDELTPLFYFPVMALSEAWEWAPLIMLVGLSVMNSVPRAIYEAADLHGASAWQKFRMVTLPAIFKSPVTQFVLVLRFIDAMRAFEIPLSWANWVGQPNTIGSPVDTLSLFLYKLLFIPSFGFPIGLVSAVAVSLFGITLVGAVILLRLLGAIGGITK